MQGLHQMLKVRNIGCNFRMINNLLISLAGVEGDAFYFDNSKYPKSIVTATSAQACHPAEVEAMQRITACGALVNEINNCKRPHGLYADAITFTINPILAEYYDDIIKCEREIVVKNEFYSLTHLETIFSLVNYFLSKYSI